MELSTYYMSNATCEYARALLERYLEGGYQFLDCMAGVDVCECMNRSMENMELLSIKESAKEGFFWCNLDSPCTDDEDAVEHVTEQVTRKVLNALHLNYGVDISEDAIRRAVDEHNQIARLNSVLIGPMSVLFLAILCRMKMEFQPYLLTDHICLEVADN